MSLRIRSLWLWSGSARTDRARDALEAENPNGMLALALLHPRHQEVLQLKYIDGLSVRETADRLQTTEKAVESRLTRARESFRKALDAMADDPEWRPNRDE